MIHVKDLSLFKTKKSKEHMLLKDISLEISTGKVTFLLGKSGSGKTSILRCLSQIEKKYQGEICYQGEGMDKLPLKKRSQIIGFVPQAYALFPFMSVLDNCAHPLRVVLGYSKMEAYRRVEEKLSLLEMQNLLHFYPHELSGGQQQRTSILRALLLDPVFLLLDEPTSALDPENTNLLIQIISRLKSEGKGIVISSQDMLFSQKICEKGYFLEHGRIMEQHDFTTTDPSILRQTKMGRFLYNENAPMSLDSTR